VTWRIAYERQAKKSLDALDPQTRRRVLAAIDGLAADPRAASNVKPLQGQPGYRLRVGDWRVMFALQDDVLTVLVIRIAHRREAYR
jgi:mRNA interferase RelE/StbE